MSLFSKLFSRDDKEPGEPQETDAAAPASNTTDAAPKPDPAAVGGATARDAKPPAATKKTEHTAVATSSDKKGPDLQPEAASSKQTGSSGTRTAEGAANKPPPLKPGAPQPKPERPRTKTMQGMAVGGGANAALPPPPAATRAEPAASKAQPPVASKAGQSPAPRADSVAKQAVLPIGAEPPTVPQIPTASIPELPSGEIPTLEVQTTSAQLRKSNAPFDVAFDAVMNALVDPSAPGTEHGHAGHDAADRRALTETFADVAKVHAHPLRELMFQLGVGRTPRQWALSSRPVLRPLLDAAQQIGMLELVGALGAFDAALERAAADQSPCIGEQAAESLKHAYQRLCMQLPDAFTPENSDGRRMVLLESLLMQVPDMHRRTLAKLYAAGLNSLDQLCQASAEEVSVVAGVELGLAENLVQHVQRFERERMNVSPSEARAQAVDRLRAVLARVSDLQTEFEQAEGRGSVADKRELRRKREAALLELDLVFAEIGELAMIEELKRSSVQGRIRRVALYIDELRASA